MALSVKLALSEPPRPLAGMLPYGDRTFLPPKKASDCPSGKLGSIIEIRGASPQAEYLETQMISGVSSVYSCILVFQAVDSYSSQQWVLKQDRIELFQG